MLESVLEGYAEFFSAELAEKVARGMRENALKCMNSGGGIPMGYVSDETQHLKIDPLTAPIVREVFNLYVSGTKVNDIVKQFNARGIKGSRGNPINFNIIHKMLINRKYIGEYKFGDTIVPGGVPAIVSQELFDQAQKKMEKNRKAPAQHKAEDDYLLTTKLFCGKCQAMMFGESGTSKTLKVYHYYKCVNNKRAKTCDKKTVQKEWLEDKVIGAIMEIVMDDALVENLAETAFELQNRESPIIPKMTEELAEIEKGIENMLNAIQQGIILDSTKKRLADLEDKKKKMELALVQEQIRNRYLLKNKFSLQSASSVTLTYPRKREDNGSSMVL